MLLIRLLFFPLGGRSSSFGAGGNAKGKMETLRRNRAPARARDRKTGEKQTDHEQEHEHDYEKNEGALAVVL
jgi:hypothetical protein